MKEYYIRVPLTGWFIKMPRVVYNSWPWAGIIQMPKQNKVNNYCFVPSNDNDIEGIYKYLSWHAYNAGLPSTVFHYLEVLKKEATK